MNKSEHIYPKTWTEPYQTEKTKAELDFINRVDHIFTELKIWNWFGSQLCYRTKKQNNPTET